MNKKPPQNKVPRKQRVISLKRKRLVPLTKKRVAILIPAHNEEKVIEATIKSALGLVGSRDIYVVDDFSSDKTAKIAKTYTRNVLSLNPNKGKAEALNTAIDHFKLTKKYEFILPMDADTSIDPNFTSESLKLFEGNNNSKVVAVCGKVIGRQTNWITSFRMWEYEISQVIHKNAQDKERAVMVCPGCSTIYKAALFDQVKFPSETITEDMDLTFFIHRMELGEIRYCNSAKVYTQDPKTIKDIYKQLDRWYTGFWQCVIKHDFPWGGQRVDYEVALSATEGLLNTFLLVIILVMIPISFITKSSIGFIPILLDLLLFIVPTVLWTAFRYRAWKLLLFFPGFYFIRIIANLIFFKSFLKTVLGIDFRVGWNKVVRYEIGKEAWPGLSTQ